MTMMNTPLLTAMSAKMAYLNRQQSVIAENIANADMPGYWAKTVEPVDFKSMLKGIGGEGQMKNAGVSLAATRPGHVAAGPNRDFEVKVDAAKTVYETSPNGNAVIIEEQMVKSNEVQMDYTLLTNLMRKQLGLIYTALGRNN